MSNERSSSSGCFSAVTRLLLCKGGSRHLQTHPTDHTPDRLTQNKDHYFSCPEDASGMKIAPTTVAAPGVVARLMGLESLPPTPPRRRASSAGADSVTRSRSVNFMDYYLLQHDVLNSSADARHRRVRTSVSFREVAPSAGAPDFILLYLEDTGGSKPNSEKSKKNVVPKPVRKSDQTQNREVIRSKSRKTEQKQRARKQSRRPELIVNNRVMHGSDSVQTRKKVHSHNRRRKCPVNQKEVAVESKFLKRIKNQKDGTGSSSQASVPPLSGKKDAIAADLSCSKRSCETELKQKQDDTARYVAKLTEEDVRRSFWVAAKGGNLGECEGIQEICVEFEQELLDLLVEELLFCR
ncbi:hypothetical protein LINPERHAP2_LOCUS8226 [Linum perenne]